MSAPDKPRRPLGARPAPSKSSTLPTESRNNSSTPTDQVHPRPPFNSQRSTPNYADAAHTTIETRSISDPLSHNQHQQLPQQNQHSDVTSQVSEGYTPHAILTSNAYGAQRNGEHSGSRYYEDTNQFQSPISLFDLSQEQLSPSVTLHEEAPGLSTTASAKATSRKGSATSLLSPLSRLAPLRRRSNHPMGQALHSLDTSVSPSQPFASPSMMHWAQVRNAVAVTSPPSSAAPLATPHSQSSMDYSSSVPTPSKRSAFPRLGFRTVVEQVAKEVVGAAMAFEDEIRELCINIKFGGNYVISVNPRQPSEVRLEKDGMGMASSTLPSSAPLGVALTAPSLSSQSASKLGLHNAPSTQSLGLGKTRQGLLRSLQQLLSNNAPVSTPMGRMRPSLPQESEVLTVLLSPFLAWESSKQVEEEKWVAVEIFEMITKTWSARSVEDDCERRMWCCKAAGNPDNTTGLRVRVLSALGDILFDLSHTPPIRSPIALQTMIQPLVMLRRSLSGNLPRSNSPDLQLLEDIISRLRRGHSTMLSVKDLADEYGVACVDLDDDREPQLCQIVATEAVVRCMQLGLEGARRWALHHVVEDNWPLNHVPSDIELTPLEGHMHLRKVLTFARGALLFLRPAMPLLDPLASRDDATAIFRIVQSRALPDMILLSHIDSLDATETRRTVTRVIVDLLSSEAPKHRETAAAVISEWWLDPFAEQKWKHVLEDEARYCVGTCDWNITIRSLRSFAKELKNDVRNQMVSVCIPLLFDRLVSDPPPPSPEMTLLLTALSQELPQVFYKPLFVCAAATKAAKVLVPLRVLMAIAQYFPNFWVSDAEMIAVALMSDPGVRMDKGKAKEGEPPSWGNARLGQCILILEIIGQFKKLSAAKKDGTAHVDSSQASVIRFVSSLEARLAILLEAKERDKLVPLSQRLLLTCMFLEMRNFSRSLKPAPWLPKIIQWTLDSPLSAGVQAPVVAGVEAEDKSAPMTRESISELSASLTEISFVYVECFDKRQSLAAKRQSTFRMSMIGDTAAPEALPNTDRQLLLASLPSRLIAALLSLLVALCGLFGRDEHNALGPLLWNKCLEDKDKAVVSSACFLVMQCAEKAPGAILPTVFADLESPQSSKQLCAINRISILFGWRFQILSQPYISDRGRRRPFRLARQPIAFVATDVGSAHYTAPDVHDETKLQIGSSLPPELRRRVLELGWGTDEKEQEERKRIWDRAPISLLPSSELEFLNPNVSNTSSNPPPTDDTPSKGGKGLLRRKSSASAYLAGAKRKAVFVPQLLVALPIITKLMLAEDIQVSAAARDIIMTIMRDDPALLARPTMEGLSGGISQGDKSISTLSTLLSGYPSIPPSLAHHLFNHLAGLLKTVSRQHENPFSITYAQALPLLAELVPHTSGLSVRELRRNKLDTIALPSFAPIPRSVAASPNPSAEVLSANLVQACMAQLAQNMIVYRMLQRDPKDINSLRKTFSQLTVPTVDLSDHARQLELSDFIPSRSKPEISSFQENLHRFSSQLARSYLLLTGQIFRSFNRHANDRGEIAKFMDGVNKILLARADDLGIVSHALIAFMVASTRFRRLFVSNAGFSLFMPALLKVYCEAEGLPAVRAAIEYTVQRFYASHRETFVFQTLEVASHIVLHPKLATQPRDQEWFAVSVFTLISTLSRTTASNGPDVAGIHGINRTQEREAVITIVNEKPELLLPSLSRVGARPPGQEVVDSLTSLSEGKSEGLRFPVDDFVRLFLTIIPHNPFILRAQYFMALFRLLVPSFYNASKSARTVLREGIQAFESAVFARLLTRSRGAEAGQTRPSEGPAEELFALEGSGSNILFNIKSSAPSEPVIMRKEYLELLAIYIKQGGRFDRGVMQKVLNHVRDCLRETSGAAEEAVRFVGELTHSSFDMDDKPSPKVAQFLLKEIVPVFRLHASLFDFSIVIDTMTNLVSDPVYAADREFVRMIVMDFCSPGLQVCHIAASEKVILNVPMRIPLIRLIAESIPLPGVTIAKTSLTSETVGGHGGVDVLAVLESQVPSPGFLAGFVLPLALTMKTSQEVAAQDTQWQVQDKWKLDSYRRAWIRILAYAMEACDHQDQDKETRSRRLWSSEQTAAEAAEPKAGEKNSIVEKERWSREQAMRFTIALQIVKVVIVRGGMEISTIMPGVWGRIAIWVRNKLKDGDANFALTSSGPLTNQPSPPVSPYQLSPSASPQKPTRHQSTLDGQFKPRPSTEQRRPTTLLRSRTSSSTQSINTSRLVDYLLWSTLELVCLFRSPLAIQLRLWTQEKMCDLESQIRAMMMHATGPESPVLGVASSPLLNVSRQSRRVSTSIFAKPRLRGQGRQSEGPSPEGSPLLGVTGSLSRSPSLLSLNQGGGDPQNPFLAYNRFPNASPTAGAEHFPSGPRIVHLGPTYPLPGPLPIVGHQQSSSPQTSLREALKSIQIRSPILLGASHRRVRVVQSSMGYDPMAMNEGDDYDERDGTPWTKGRALQSIMEESKALMEEFRDWFYVDDDQTRESFIHVESPT